MHRGSPRFGSLNAASWALASPRTWVIALCLTALVGPVLLIVDSGRTSQDQLVAVYPDEFIPLAEETGQIVALGDQVLRAAVAQAAAWNATAAPGAQCRIGVNVSVHQLMEAEFTDSVRDALTQARLDPELLVLEITESALIEQGDTAVRQCLSDLRSLGVHIALDDFGTGYASLISLHDLPIDIIKIDKSFLAHLDTSPRMAELMAGIFAIADRLGLRTIAEGVTTAEQRDTLIAMRCLLGQGYFYSRPLPAAQATALRTGTQHFAPSS